LFQNHLILGKKNSNILRAWIQWVTEPHLTRFLGGLWSLPEQDLIDLNHMPGAAEASFA
jgi:hypothetical protein